MTQPLYVRGFGAVATWVFDLDNTLYPHHLNLWQQVDVRIRDYIAGFLKVTHDEAFRLQKDLCRRYGTSLRGLMEEHGIDPDEFLAVVHNIDHSPLTPNPELGAAIADRTTVDLHSHAGHLTSLRVIRGAPFVPVRGAMRDGGMSLRAIAARLNAEEIPTVRGGAEWRASSVSAAAGSKRRAARRRRVDLPVPMRATR